MLRAATSHLASVFCSLSELQSLNCSHNKIKSAKEIVEVLRELKELKKANFGANPVCKTTKYRETMLVNCNNRLSTLDGKEIDHRQRDALIRFAQHRMNKKKHMKAQRENDSNYSQHNRQPLAQNQQRNY